MLGPIFTREFLTVPRRDRHFTSRVAALGLLWVIGITAWQATVGFTADAQLGETARFGLLLFQIVAFVQLTLLLFFSALSAASTVSQEKDRRTFILLLLTDMRDYEIVLGKMLGSLLPIGILFAVTVPYFALVLLLGGVSGEQVAQAIIVLAATAIAAGSLGGLIALVRERTFQALALAVLALVFYLFLVEGIGLAVRQLPGGESSMVTSWLDPFTAMTLCAGAAAEGADSSPRLRFRAGDARSLGGLEWLRHLETAQVEPERRARAAARSAGGRRRPTPRSVPRHTRPPASFARSGRTRFCGGRFARSPMADGRCS